MIAEQAMLIYLDNFEHLLEATPMLDTLLERCPNLKIVLSTREVVTSDWAHLYSLEGLAFPPEDCSFEDVLSYAAVELFVEQGEKVDSSFALTQENYKAVIDICQQVKGLALAVKLAASWLSASEAKTIAEELKDGIDLLDDIKINQRGISTSLELSYERLSSELQQAFAKLVVFNGGFDLKAAKEVCDIKLTQLRDLQNKSLIEWDAEAKRYGFHPLIRKYAESKVEAEVLEDLKQKHSKYYLKLLRVITDGIQEERNQAVRLLKPEKYNVQDAWMFAIEECLFKELEISAHALERFFDETANFVLGSKYLQDAIDKLCEDNRSQKKTLGSLLASKAWLEFRLTNYSIAITLAERAIEFSNDDFQARSTALNVLGSSYKYLRDYDSAKKYYYKGLDFSKNHPGHYATVLSNLGTLESDFGKFDLAEKLFLEVLDIRNKQNQFTRLPDVLNYLGNLKLVNNQFQEARVYFEDALSSASKLKLDRSIFLTKSRIYYIQFCLGDSEGVEALLKESLSEARHQNALIEEIKITILLVRVLYIEQKYQESLEYIRSYVSRQYIQNSVYTMYESVIIFLKICKKIDSEKSSKIYMLLNKKEILLEMTYIERKEFETINLDMEITEDQFQNVKVELNEVYSVIEKWINNHLSI